MSQSMSSRVGRSRREDEGEAGRAGRQGEQVAGCRLRMRKHKRNQRRQQQLALLLHEAGTLNGGRGALKLARRQDVAQPGRRWEWSGIELREPGGRNRTGGCWLGVARGRWGVAGRLAAMLSSAPGRLPPRRPSLSGGPVVRICGMRMAWRSLRLSSPAAAPRRRQMQIERQVRKCECACVLACEVASKRHWVHRNGSVVCLDGQRKR